MLVTATLQDLETSISKEIPDPNGKQREQLFELSFSKSQLERKIANLPMNADAKAMLSSLAKRIVKVGETVLRIGQKFLELVFRLNDEYGHLSFGEVICLMVEKMFQFAPIVGQILGPLLLNFLTTIGQVIAGQGAMVDAALQTRVSVLLNVFEPFRHLT